MNLCKPGEAGNLYRNVPPHPAPAKLADREALMDRVRRGEAPWQEWMRGEVDEPPAPRHLVAVPDANPFDLVLGDYPDRDDDEHLGAVVMTTVADDRAGEAVADAEVLGDGDVEDGEDLVEAEDQSGDELLRSYEAEVAADEAKAAARAAAVEKEAERVRVQRDAKALVDAERGVIVDLTEFMVAGSTFIDDLPEGIPAVWGSGLDVVWARGEALILCGPAGVGKTTIVHQVAAAMLGGGGKVLGLDVGAMADGEHLLILACDRPRQIARAIRRQLRDVDRAILAAKLTVWKGPPPGDFAKDQELLLRLCQTAGATHVIVDSLKDVAVGLSEDVVGSALNISRQRALAAGIEVAELHHLVKRGADGGPPTKLADVYGSTWITAGAGSVLLVWGEAGDLVVKVTHLKQPGNDVGPLTVVHDHNLGVSTVEDAADLVVLAGQHRDGITASKAAEVVFGKDKPTRNEVEKARRKLNALVAKGRLTVATGGARGGGGTDATATRWVPASTVPFEDSREQAAEPVPQRYEVEANHES